MNDDARLWHIAHAPSVPGPLTTEELVASVRAGRIPPGASAWTEGMPQWQRIEDIPETRVVLGTRVMDAMPRRQLLLLGTLSTGTGVLLFFANVLRSLAGHDVGALWPGIAGGIAAPGVLMLWKAFRRRP